MSEKKCTRQSRKVIWDMSTFHLSELTDQLISIVMGISLLINNKPSRSVKSYTLCSKEMVFQQILLEKAVSFPKCLVWPWSGRPVLTYEKRRMINTLFLTLSLLNLLLLLSFSSRKHTSMASRAILSNFFEEK